jgi:hypothetical protein
MLVLLNYGASPAQVSTTGNFPQELRGRVLKDLLTGEEITAGANITLAGEDVRILRPQ